MNTYRRRQPGFKARRYVLLALGVLAGVWLAGMPVPVHAQGPVEFDDSDPAVLILSNDVYTVTLSKVNGAILALEDQAAGSNLTLGSRSGCLWGAVFLQDAEEEFIGGCSYAAGDPNDFAYTWDPAHLDLVLTYTWEPGVSPRVDAVLTLTASTDHFFDLQLAVDNQSGKLLKKVLLPCDLRFSDHHIEAAYGPFVLPGARLNSGFFTEDRNYTPTYPSDAAFADFIAYDVASGHLAIYTINPAPNPIVPVALGFIDDDAYLSDSFYNYHTWRLWMPEQQTWHSPRVRLRIGQTPEATILAYRQENGIAAYPAVTDKLGVDWDTWARAPLIKADLHIVNQTFLELVSDLDLLPSPAVLHPVAFQPRGHDENYPDFLPPDPLWGSTADFRTLVEAAQARGLLVMPYINPSWWDEESPTMQNLDPLTISDVAVLNEQGNPVTETYGSHEGYAVSPYVSFVQQRIDALMTQWREEVPVDCVFEDQIGARAWLRDFNPASPTAIAYSDGWLEHTVTYADRCLMTEMGWDRLAETEVGFHGSLLTWAREFDHGARHWGAGNWAPYPMATWLFHDKVLMYQHDLSHHTMSTDRGTLTWNLAFGTMLSYNWQWADNDPLHNPWLELVAALQRAVVSRIAGQGLSEYTALNRDVTRSVFGDIAVIANWHPTLPYDVDGHRVAPGGFYAWADDDSVVAGVFIIAFDDNELAPGEHYLIIERNPIVVTVRQPVGTDTVLAVPTPASWQPGDTLWAYAMDQSGTPLGQVSFWMDGEKVKLIYRQSWEDQPVDHYQILMNAFALYLPVSLRG